MKIKTVAGSCLLVVLLLTGMELSAETQQISSGDRRVNLVELKGAAAARRPRSG